MGLREPERKRAVRLSDGRTVAWSEWGSPDGVPVLFCTGAGMSGSFGFGADDLGPLGLRLIAVDRPGLGASDPHPSKTLETWVDDMREFASLNGLRGAGAVGFSQGAPFALALSASGIVGATALVSGQDELAHPALVPLLDPRVDELIRAIRRDPSEFERSFTAIAGPDALWHLIVHTSSERDRSVYLDAAFSVPFQRCLREGFARGPAPYVRDLVNSLSPWPFSAERVTAPVSLWYGALDTSTVHSPDFGATLEQRLPNASRTVSAEDGGSILWTKSRVILWRLKAALS